VLALSLETRGALQISMNLEDLEATSPMDVFERIESWLRERGGHVEGTEVIGLLTDPLVLPAASDRLRLLDPRPSRLLSARLAAHLSKRAVESMRSLVDVVAAEGAAVPDTVAAAARTAAEAFGISSTPSHES
jgi:hypothetical protein